VAEIQELKATVFVPTPLLLPINEKESNHLTLY